MSLLHLDLGTALLIWMLVGTLAHEYGHLFMAKMRGCKTIGFFAFPIPGVLIDTPFQKSHAILILAGGWIFGVVSIFPFLLFVTPEYIIVFLITALVIETILSSISDGVSILHTLWIGVKTTWSEYHKSVFRTHNNTAGIGLSKMVIINRKEYDKLTKELACTGYSVAFFDIMGTKDWVVLLSLLTLCSALMVFFVNWPVFLILSLFGIKIEVDFSTLFLVLAGASFMLTITERLILHYHKK